MPLPPAARVLSPAVRLLTRSPLVARLLFGVRPSALEDPGEQYFDATTLGLLRKAARCIPRGARVLDVGTGSAAAVALWLWRRRGCRVTCTEIDGPVAERARESVRRAGAPIQVLHAPLFGGLEDDFDFITFNPPYLCTRIGRTRGLSERIRSQWDGGEGGTAVAADFLRAFEARGRGGRALLGLNRWHVPRARVEALVDASPGIRSEEVWSDPWLPVDVHVLARS